jgi:hypothetical protein
VASTDENAEQDVRERYGEDARPGLSSRDQAAVVRRVVLLVALTLIDGAHAAIAPNIASVAAAIAAVAIHPSTFQRVGRMNSPTTRGVDEASMTAIMIGTEITALITADQ